MDSFEHSSDWIETSAIPMDEPIYDGDYLDTSTSFGWWWWNRTFNTDAVPANGTWTNYAVHLVIFAVVSLFFILV